LINGEGRPDISSIPAMFISTRFVFRTPLGQNAPSSNIRSTRPSAGRGSALLWDHDTEALNELADGRQGKLLNAD
jgi:hypothetical protein